MAVSCVLCGVLCKVAGCWGVERYRVGARRGCGDTWRAVEMHGMGTEVHGVGRLCGEWCRMSGGWVVQGDVVCKWYWVGVVSGTGWVW